MGITYGFYNSLNGDRKYDAVQLSSIFDGIIIDGVFASIGTCFVTKAEEVPSRNVRVGIGKAWFNHSWILNDSILPIEAPISELLLDRIDALVLEFDGTEAIRANDIKFIQGVPSSTPIRPTLINTKTLVQKPICYIRRKANVDTITDADIDNMIGSDETPFVTGILQTISITELIGKWEDELDQFVASEQEDFTNWMTGEKAEFNNWFIQLKEDLLEEQRILDEWIASEQSDFIAWFNQMKGQLSTDAAGRLQLEIDRNEINDILIVGFIDGTKEFSDDGTNIVSTASDGRTLTKTFTNGFLTMTNVLRTDNGNEIARMVKTFASDGKTISTVVTYV